MTRQTEAIAEKQLVMFSSVREGFWGGEGGREGGRGGREVRQYVHSRVILIRAHHMRQLKHADYSN